MAATLKISTGGELDELEREARELGGAVQGEGVKNVIGRAIANLLREHFRALEFSPAHHRTAAGLGAPRTGFYSEAARGVQQPQLFANGVAVSINQVGLAQRFFGGTIVPRNSKLLTIPARTESYGKRASEFNNLRLVMFRSGAGALVERAASVFRGSKKDGTQKGDSIGGLIVFWLVKQVTQKADPTVLPTDNELGTAALNAARSFVNRLQLRKAAA